MRLSDRITKKEMDEIRTQISTTLFLIPRITIGSLLDEIDALKAELKAQRAAVLEEAAIVVQWYSSRKQTIDAIRALATQDERDALEMVKQERDDLWIAAFGAEDLKPRVTPKSLADWVFRDVQQQLDGLKKELDALAEHDKRLLEEAADECEGAQIEACETIARNCKVSVDQIVWWNEIICGVGDKIRALRGGR